MKVFYYLGSFPPPYGGVTNKNELIFEELSRIAVLKRNVSTNKIKNVLYLGRALLFGSQFIVGIGSNRKLETITKILYMIKKKCMERSIVFVMGGTMADELSDNTLLMAKQYKKMYVETNGMLRKLESKGLNNVALFPNCRKRPAKNYRLNRSDERVKCVFFSTISKAKGAMIIIDVARSMPEIEFHFYGDIKPDIDDSFNNAVEGLPNAYYHGKFNGKGEETYEELAKYDIMLLPTSWKHEGVPGVLIEAKIAGLSIIASDYGYNSEIVVDGYNGYLVNNSPNEIREKLLAYVADRGLLSKHKQNSEKSASKYFIDNYIDAIIQVL
ncbi:MAG: glycosyltransferase [Butyrivibrio sp.]|nr:glycosyltransferase [Butyrivibrio sp.]